MAKTTGAKGAAKSEAAKQEATKQEVLLVFKEDGTASLQRNCAVGPDGKLLSASKGKAEETAQAAMDNFKQNPGRLTVREYDAEQAAKLKGSLTEDKAGKPISYELNGEQRTAYSFKAELRQPDGDKPGGFRGAEPSGVKMTAGKMAVHEMVADTYTATVREAQAIQARGTKTPNQAYGIAMSDQKGKLEAAIKSGDVYSMEGDSITYKGLPKAEPKAKSSRFDKGVQATADAPQAAQAEAQTEAEVG